MRQVAIRFFRAFQVSDVAGDGDEAGFAGCLNRFGRENDPQHLPILSSSRAFEIAHFAVTSQAGKHLRAVGDRDINTKLEQGPRDASARAVSKHREPLVVYVKESSII